MIHVSIHPLSQCHRYIMIYHDLSYAIMKTHRVMKTMTSCWNTLAVETSFNVKNRGIAALPQRRGSLCQYILNLEKTMESEWDMGCETHGKSCHIPYPMKNYLTMCYLWSLMAYIENHTHGYRLFFHETISLWNPDEAMPVGNSQCHFYHLWLGLVSLYHQTKCWSLLVYEILSPTVNQYIYIYIIWYIIYHWWQKHSWYLY